MNTSDLRWARSKVKALLAQIAAEMKAEGLVALAAAMRLEGRRP
jgi:hypothetical protein